MKESACNGCWRARLCIWSLQGACQTWLVNSNLQWSLHRDQMKEGPSLLKCFHSKGPRKNSTLYQGAPSLPLAHSTWHPKHYLCHFWSIHIFQTLWLYKPYLTYQGLWNGQDHPFNSYAPPLNNIITNKLKQILTIHWRWVSLKAWIVSCISLNVCLGSILCCCHCARVLIPW